MTNSNVSFISDAYYLSYLDKGSYMGAVSPWFFTVSRDEYHTLEYRLISCYISITA